MTTDVGRLVLLNFFLLSACTPWLDPLQESEERAMQEAWQDGAV